MFQLASQVRDEREVSLVERYFAKKGKNHALGTTRIGDQIDLVPVSSQVARDSDLARNLNAGVKKKESQRQRETNEGGVQEERFEKDQKE